MRVKGGHVSTLLSLEGRRRRLKKRREKKREREEDGARDQEARDQEARDERRDVLPRIMIRPCIQIRSLRV